MKKFLNNRVLPIVCALSILVSLLVVPVSAASGVGIDTGKDTANCEAWASYITSTDPVFGDLFSSQFNVDFGYKIFFRIIDDVVGHRYGEVDLDELHTICTQLNEAFCNKPISDLYSFVDVTSAIANYTLMTCFRLPNMRFEVDAGGGTAGFYRIKDTVSGLFVVNGAGWYPCTPIDGEFTDTEKHNHWVSKSSAEQNLRYSQVLTGSDMRQMCTSLQVAGEQAYVADFGSKYKAIYRDGREVYANSDGYPFVSSANDAEWAVNQSRPDTSVKDENGETVEGLPEENTTNIDLSGMTITLPDGSINLIDKIIYDESTKSYHIDSHDTYNSTINNYYTWNYYINYTSITYIGQTEEYNKYYEVYYELPDGRDSADLTREELEQLNVSVDVLPYSRAVDDVSLKSLYHFDGDIRDASFWNYTTEFRWNKGASITYMDAGVFNGALYLDETEHDFSFILPQFIRDDAFTLQFRYYQSATVAPQTDSSLSVGGTTILQFDGANIKDASGTVLSAMPIGTWNEICLVRSDSAGYIYLNGLVIGNFSLGSVSGNIINFHFGSGQQTFKYFDEFRFLTKELYPTGSSYTPTAVPFDTNLTLVVPDGDYIVADEWIEWTGGETAYASFDFTHGPFPEFDDRNIVCPTGASKVFSIYSSGSSFPLDFEWTEKGLVLTRPESSVGFVSSGASYLAMNLEPYKTLIPYNSYPNIVIWGADGNNRLWTYCYAGNGDGDSTFTYYTSSDGSGNLDSFPLNNGQVPNAICMFPHSGSFIISRIDIYPQSAGPSEFAEVIKHSSVSVMDPSQLRTPSLAVRTDLEITNYQIGGVRPSVPTKGLVWAMVESGYITSIQIYNGQAWEGCDGRIWTGERWVPARSYNVITMQDMYDIVDSTPNYEYIYSESGFWSWWQKSWNAFTEKLFSVLGSGGSGGTSSASGTVKEAVSNALSSLIEGIFSVITEVLKSLIGAAKDLLSGIFSFFTDTVLGGISDFFSSLGELVNPFESTVENEDGTTTTTTELPEGISAVFAFFSGAFLAMPAELRMITMFGIGLMLLLAVFKKVSA